MSDTDGVRHLKSPILALGVCSGTLAQPIVLQPELASGSTPSLPMQDAMLLRLILVLVPAAVLAAVDLGINAALPAHAWDFHQRSPLWSTFAAALFVVLLLLAVLPSRLVAVSAGVVAGGVLGNLIAAREHGGRVPNPIAVGSFALNVADIFVLAGVPLMVFALARVSISHREQIDRMIPPRRWEISLRRRLRL